jgi:hypothetical protein
MHDIQIELLKRKREIAKLGLLTVNGHKFASLVRKLYIDKHLTLIRVEDQSRNLARPFELDFNNSESIRTYDDLIKCTLNEDYTISVWVREGTESFRSTPSRPRAVFHLSGKWWMAEGLDRGFVEEIENGFTRYAIGLRELEELSAKAHRVKCIEQELLGGVYVLPEGVE